MSTFFPWNCFGFGCKNSHGTPYPCLFSQGLLQVLFTFYYVTWIFHIAFEHMVANLIWLSICMSLETLEEMRCCPRLSPSGALLYQRLFSHFFSALKGSQFFLLVCDEQERKAKKLAFWPITTHQGWSMLCFNYSIYFCQQVETFFLIVQRLKMLECRTPRSDLKLRMLFEGTSRVLMVVWDPNYRTQCFWTHT